MNDRQTISASATVVADAEERAALEAENALLQFDLVLDLIDEHLRGGRPFRLRLSTILTLHAEAMRVFKLPDVQEKLKTLGLDPVLSTPEELAKYQADEVVKWARVVKESGAKAD